MFVVTREPNTLEVLIWDPLRGERNSPERISAQYYQEVHCLFNHRSFYANIQKETKVRTCVWKLEDGSQWMTMDRAMTASHWQKR